MEIYLKSLDRLLDQGYIKYSYGMARPNALYEATDKCSSYQTIPKNMADSWPVLTPVKIVFGSISEGNIRTTFGGQSWGILKEWIDEYSIERNSK